MDRREALEVLKRDLSIQKENKALPDGIEALEIAVQAIEELEGYKTICASQQALLDELRERVITKNDAELLEKALVELQQYRELGTVEEIIFMHGERDGFESRCMVSEKQLEEYQKLGNLKQVRELVSRGNAYDQVAWERDIAIEQLEELGLSLGETTDSVCEAIDFYKMHDESCYTR